nr:MAG TPA: hypothetical protein [Caudoviricetes sp.]
MQSIQKLLQIVIYPCGRSFKLPFLVCAAAFELLKKEA